MNIVGIDLGTTFSVVAQLNSIGKPEIVPNSDSERLTLSAVYFKNDEFKSKEDVVVGIEAINFWDEDKNDRLARWIKKFMGEKYYDKEILGKKWEPAVLSSFILGKLKDDFEAQKGKMDYAVITVPAYFDEIRREATLQAGKLAGINVKGIVNEPTAAALYYATNNDIKGKILVFDLGGGTFDVTILEVDGTKIDILASLGDHDLGGFNFDQQIVKQMLEKHKEKHRISDEECKKFTENVDIQMDAEKLKKNLSKRESSKLNSNYKENHFSMEMTRTQLETMISNYMAKIEMLIEAVLDEINITPEEIDDILLAGGSTRLPSVERLLKSIFKKEPLKIGNVDECVSLGAAIYCGLLIAKDNPKLLDETIRDSLSNIFLQEVCNHSYGTKILSIDYETGRPNLVNDILISKNSKIPIVVEKLYYTVSDNQEGIDISITQGEGIDVEMVTEILSDYMELPKGRPEGMPIRVEYSYDRNQIMQCTFIDVTANLRKMINIDATSGAKVDKDAKEIYNLIDI